MNIFITTQLIAFIGVFLIISAFGCDEDKIEEASEAFKNCAGSSEGTIYRRIAEEKEEDRPTKICTILDSLYSGCKAQQLTLEKCDSSKEFGVPKAADILQARYDTVQYILGLQYKHIDVASCPIFKKPEETMPDRPSFTAPSLNVEVNHKTIQGTENKNKLKLSQDFSHDNSVAYAIAPNSLFCYLIILLSFRAYF